MSARLEAWLEGEHAGQFIFADDGTVRFEYDEGASAISLSLPRDRPHSRKAAANYLENLLPDHEITRARMAAVYGAESSAALDLLSKAGGDIAGGLVILPEGQSPVGAPLRLNPALDRDIADRINSIKLDPDAWAPRDVDARFSLAGTQGKFALAEISDDWYWSNATLPSTHIVKPARPELRNLEAAEAATLKLASSAGIEAAHAEVLAVEDQTSFITRRFDRQPGDVVSTRLHAEDFAQALGIGPGAKYEVAAKTVLRMLGDTRVARDFIRQLAFNTIIGNADAHAKNYSLLIRPDGILLAPMYDAVPVGLYPAYNQRLAMPIGGARFPAAATPDRWRKLARAAQLDEGEVTDLVADVAGHVLEHADAAWGSLDLDQSALMRDAIRRHADVAAGERGKR